MDVIAAVAVAVLGLFLVFVSLGSAFRTVVLPRAAFDPLTRAVFLGFRSFLLLLSRLTARHLDREMVLSLHAPLGLLTLALTWAIGIILGFSLMFEATAEIDIGEAVVLAGSSFTTLGFVAPMTRAHEFLSIIAAILGLGVVALLISYLPTIYGLFSRREVTVADITIKSGGVAHGPDLVRNLSRGHDLTRLDELWAEWGHWCIALGETHTSEPSLNFFRSPQSQRSWLSTVVAVLDAAAIRNSVISAPQSIRAEMTHRAGVEALVSIAHFFFVRPQGKEAQVLRLTRGDFDAMTADLAGAGMPLVADLDAAWEDFAALRRSYEPHARGLALLIIPPPAPWCATLFARPLSADRDPA